MNNKETLQSYNTNLSENNDTLSSILNTINNLPEAGDATTEKPKVLSELEQRIIGITQEHIDYLFGDYVETFATYTEEPVTLYTPSGSNMYYMIRSRSSANNQFSIVWLPKKVLRLDSAGGSVAPAYIRSVDFEQLEQTPVDSGFLSYYPETVTGYYSANYSTIEECITAIQSPNTTYTSTNSANWGSYEHEGYKVSYSNMPVANATTYDTLYPGRRISSNETIEVIPTTE